MISPKKKMIQITFDKDMLEFIELVIAQLNKSTSERWTKSKFFERLFLITYGESLKEFEKENKTGKA